MKIRDLHIDGFGHFSDRDFGPFARPVTVFHGPNEAGKTTLLEFIRTVLFGFLDGRSRRNLYLPLSGGRHGGSITVESDDGEVTTVRRVSGTGGGQVTLTGEAGNPIPRTELSRLLGSHSRKTFETLFGFTLDELHDDALLSDDSVNSQIYSAGMGATRLPGALKMLDDQKRDLFLSGGSKHAIHTTAGRLDEVDSKLREVESNAAEYGHQSARLREIEQEMALLRKRRLEVESELKGHHSLESAWDDWIDLGNAQRSLDEIPKVDEFPEGGAARLETLEERVKTAREEHDLAVDNVKSAKDRATVDIGHESLIEQREAIRDIQQGRNGFDQSVKDVPERETELTAKRTELRNTLNDLGPDWDIDRLRDFDLSIVVREKVSTFGERLRDAADLLRRTQSALTAAESALTDASGSVERSQNNLDSAPVPTLDEDQIRQRRGHIRTARDTLDDLARTQDRVTDLKDRFEGETESGSASTSRGGTTVVAAVLGIVGIVLAIAGAFLGESALILGLIAGVFLVSVAVYLFVRSRLPTQVHSQPRTTRIRLDEAEAHLSEIRTRLDEEAVAIGIDALGRASLSDMEQSLDDEQARLNEVVSLAAVLEQAKERIQTLTIRRDDSRQTVEDTKSALETAEGEWSRWLTERGLREGFSPDSIEELRRLVDLGRAHFNSVMEMEDRIEAIKTDIREFVEIVRPLAAAHGFDLDPADHTRAAAVADSLIELYEEVSESARKRTDAQEDLRNARDELNRREKVLRKAEGEVDDLVSRGGARDAEEFRLRAQAYDERQKAESAMIGALDNLRRISGPGDALETLRSRLAASTPQSIDTDIRRSEEDLKEIREKIEDLATRRGEVEKTLSDMLSEKDSSRLRVERHRLLEEIRGYAHEWTVRTIAQNLLKAAQSKFEKERQPDVIRHSEKFFRDITDGRYATVFSPLDESEIYVTDSEGAQKQPQQLSRGTREQLFLTLRFGLVRDVGQRAERLPVIVDEALVNFDPVRGLRAAGAFMDLAQTNQVLVFTCHPQIVDQFVDAASERGAQPPEIIEISEAVS